MYILKLTTSPSYRRLLQETPFCFFILDFFLEINDLNPLGVGIYEIQQSWQL